MKISLIADQAIGEADTRTVDGLGFETYSQVLAAAIADTRGPFTIGIFGEWGTGKTSLMHLIENRLEGNDDIVTVWFNAWRYEKEDHPIVPLVGTIIHGLEKHKGLSQRFGAAGRQLIRSLRAIAYGFSAKSKVKVPGFAEVEASFVAKDMIDRDEQLTPDPLLDRSLYFGAFNSLDEVRLRENVRVVVLIDDLDRCFPDQAIRLLESIKLVLAQPGFIFVIGVARVVLEGYLQHRYASEYGIQDFKGQLYLDKIVQLPFHIPPASRRMGKFCEALLADQPTQLVVELEPILPLIAEALGGNPRALIRFVNNILVDFAISVEHPDFTEVGGIPIRFFAVTRCLEHRWPDVFSALLASVELTESVAAWDTTTYAERAGGTGPDAVVATKLLSDPELRTLLGSPHGKEWLKDSALRQASVSFLLAQQRFSQLDTSEVRPRYDVFVSFQSDARREALRLVELLSGAGIRVFSDWDIEPGDKFNEVIHQALGSSGALIFCVSRNTPGSDWQNRELESALSQGRMPVIPILLPGADTENMSPRLRDYQWLDFRDGVSQANLDRLLSAVQRFVRRR